MIDLVVKPDMVPITWQKFMRTHDPLSIALDGYVRMGPRFNPTGPWANYNHHEGVSRMETRATCAQVLVVIRTGLFKTFRNENGNPAATIYVNDCDEDISLAVFLLRHHSLVEGVLNPTINRLVFMEDMLDTMAGSYPFPQDLDSLQALMWVFNPYHRFRVSGQLDKKNPDDFKSVIEDVGLRIMAYMTGGGEKIELDTRYNVLGGGSEWSLVSEIGANARVGVFGDGIDAFVSVRDLGDGRYVYTIGRASVFVPFPIPKILKALNQEEGCKDDTWGGSDIIAGSPRVGASSLEPSEVTRIIEDVI